MMLRIVSWNVILTVLSLNLALGKEKILRFLWQKTSRLHHSHDWSYSAMKNRFLVLMEARERCVKRVEAFKDTACKLNEVDLRFWCTRWKQSLWSAAGIREIGKAGNIHRNDHNSNIVFVLLSSLLYGLQLLTFSMEKETDPFRGRKVRQQPLSSFLFWVSVAFTWKSSPVTSWPWSSKLADFPPPGR